MEPSDGIVPRGWPFFCRAAVSRRCMMATTSRLVIGAEDGTWRARAADFSQKEVKTRANPSSRVRAKSSLLLISRFSVRVRGGSL